MINTPSEFAPNATNALGTKTFSGRIAWPPYPIPPNMNHKEILAMALTKTKASVESLHEEEGYQDEL
jgi:hypothetical protein